MSSRAIIVAGAALVCLCWSFCPAGENLFKDGSFEEVAQPSQFGLVWKNWGGYLYEPAARFAAGAIARSGKLSYEMIGDDGCKIRLQSPQMKLEPGRYRVRVFIRGLSIGKGQWGEPLDFSVGFNGQWFQLKKLGVAEATFGWRPITYVFDVARPTGDFRLFVGLLGAGWLWVDDAELEKVDDSVAVTREPVIGKEESPIAPPAKIVAGARHCPQCAYLNNGDAVGCYACGAAMPSPAKSELPPVKVLADFEDGQRGIFSSGKVTTDNVPDGKYGLVIDVDYATVERTAAKPMDWSGYDYFTFDTYNPHDEPVDVLVEIRDALTREYWTRVNYNTIIPPGKSSITIPTDIYVGEKSRPGRALAADKITMLIINPQKKNVVVDNFRLQRLDTSAVKFDGLVALDFGGLDTPAMEGFSQCTMAMSYCPQRGFGWDKADLWRSFNAFQPDALYQDFICPRGGDFRVDLPNGRYHVLMNIDSPGGYWGEVQVYKNRKVTANGKAVIDEKMDLESFKKWYFRHAHREDLPGIDTFKEYVEPMFSVKEFDVDVTDGKLSIGFAGQGFAVSLSAMVIYPQAKASRGKTFWDWVTQRRRVQFDNYFRQVHARRVGAAAPDKDYVVFRRHFMKTPNAFDGPQEGEAIGADGLSLTVAQDEESPVTFSVQPSAKLPQGLGAIDVAVSDLAYRGPMEEHVAPLRATCVQAGWLDYRLTRVTMEGSVYTVSPRYWHPAPAPGAPNVTRTFWLRVKVPAGTQAGPYAGKITIKPANGPAREVPLAITVLPFALDPIKDVAVGPWGSGIDLPWDHGDPAGQTWRWQMFAKALDAIKDAGCTSFSGRPTLTVKAAKGKVELDATIADKEMQLIRAKGFDHIISNYGAADNMGYKMYGNGGGPDVEAAKNAGFSGMEAFLKAIYTQIDAHAAANNWVPVAWNLCDEPLGDAIRGAVLNAQAHRAILPGLKHSTFMGATSIEGDDPKNPHHDLARALPVPSLNLHDEKSLKALHDAGNKFSFYNGGNRWTYGRYMKMLVLKHDLMLRLSWHYNVAAGDPYYALDCREDDYCWYNTDADQSMTPSVALLGRILPGLNDYRYLTTLERLIKAKSAGAGGGAQDAKALQDAGKVFDDMMNLRAGADRTEPKDVEFFDVDRANVVKAIQGLMR